MIDYKGLEALFMVHKLQSFELAAKALYITQSAISQRIKALETFYGEPALTRTLPYHTTKLGTHLLGHYKKVSVLEDNLDFELGKNANPPSVSIAINRDSLETWFPRILEKTKLLLKKRIEIIANDEEFTLQYLKNGTVSACVSTQEKEIQGGSSTFLGNMDYILVASPSLLNRFFTKKDAKHFFIHAPAMKFDTNDRLHERYIERFFHLNSLEIPFHIIPSVQCFKKFALLGYAYGLIPKIDIMPELKEKKLVQIFPDKIWQVPLYWHSWKIESSFHKEFNEEMTKLIRSILTQK